MKQFPLLIAALVLLISSCTKHAATENILIPQGNTTVSGKIIDKTTGQGIANVPVYLAACPRAVCCAPTDGIGDPSPGIDCRPNDSTISDQNGNYRFVFDSLPNTNYSLAAFGNTNFRNDSTNNLAVDLHAASANNFILSPVRVLLVNIHIRNSSKNSFYTYGTTTKNNIFYKGVAIRQDAAIVNFDTTLIYKTIALSNFTLFSEGCIFNAGVYTDCGYAINTRFFIDNRDTTTIHYTIN